MHWIIISKQSYMTVSEGSVIPVWRHPVRIVTKEDRNASLF